MSSTATLLDVRLLLRRVLSDTVPSHQLSLRKLYLKLIADGVKTVEARVSYPEMR
jgi:hypothetical protein